jgi:dihydrofolate reductase
MACVRVDNFTISLDGYAAGPDQSIDAPLGRGGEQLHAWAFATRTFREHLGMEGGTSSGVDDEMVARGNSGLGATIMGRNMFGPLRGPWGASEWNGWWGEEPPFRHPVFVLTHHARPSLTMAGGTTFHFVTDGLHAAVGGQSMTTVTNRVLDTLAPGSIVLMHVGSHPTDRSTLDADALPRVIKELKDRGYSFVTLDAYR